MSARALPLFLLGLTIPGVFGCVTLPGSVANGEGSRAEAITGKRQARPSTYVAYGELHEKAAAEPGRSPAEQEELRKSARLAYQKALEVNSKDLGALLALARLYNAEGEYERAVTTYNRAIQIYPKDPALRYELGLCQARRKNWDQALQNLQKATQMDPENRRYAYSYGLCLARARRYGDSFLVLEKLEGAANAHYDLARMMHHLEQDDACREQLEMALAKNPELFGAQQLLIELEATAPGTRK